MAIASNNGRLPTIVKWAGGKKQLLSQFKPYFPEKIDRYFEPFLGSAAVFFYIKKEYDPKEVILSDKLKELMNCYNTVKEDVDELLESLEVHKKKHSKKYYYELRKETNFVNLNGLSDTELASRFIYFNKTCWNGLYRVNSKGTFNVPINDKIEGNNIYDENILREASEMLQNVTIKTQSFEGIVEEANSGDFVYLDPPYHPLSTTSNFTGYTRVPFSEEDQKRVAEIYKELDKTGCRIMLSNSDHPFIRELYDGFEIATVQARRMINCIAEKRGEISEIVVMNY